MRHRIDDRDGPTKFSLATGISVGSLTKWTRWETRELANMTPLSAIALAKALGYETLDALDEAWQSTPVKAYPRKANGREEPRKPSAAARLANVMDLRKFTTESLAKAARTSPELIERLLNGGKAHRIVIERIAAKLVRSGDTDPNWIEGLITDESAFDELLAQIEAMDLGQLQAVEAVVRKRMKEVERGKK